MSSRKEGDNPILLKPRAGVAATSTAQQHSPNPPQQPRSGNCTLVPVYVLPEHLRQVQQFVLSLGQPIFSSPTMEGYFQPEALNADNSSDVNRSDESLDPLELVSVFSSLSTSASNDYVQSTPSASTTVHSIPAFISTSTQDSPIPSISHIPLQSSASPTKPLNRYYSVLVGKKTGVFWDEWANVEPLVKNVSGARFRGFPTHRDALAFYLEAKMMRRVRVIRDPGDDLIYGPDFQAMQ